MRRHALHVLVVFVNWLLRWPPHGMRILVLRHLALADVGPQCSIERRIRIEARRGLWIGERTTINRGVLLDSRGDLTIGKLVNISPEAMLLTADHDPTDPDFEDRKRSVVVSDRSWIGTRAIILPGAEIGEGAVVAAGSVVHGRVSPWTIVAGNPAVQIGIRPPSAQRNLPKFRRLLN